MFCQNCGSWARKGYKYCPGCGISSAKCSSREGSSGVARSLNTFKEFKDKKSTERTQLIDDKNTAKNKKGKIVVVDPVPVIITIGIATNLKGTFKPIRGKSIPLKIINSASVEAVREEAIKKIAFYDRSFRNDLTYQLCYPDGSEVITLPGIIEPFTLEKYKEDLGRNYSRITLFLCPVQEEAIEDDADRMMSESSASGACVNDDFIASAFISSEDESDLLNSIFDGNDGIEITHYKQGPSCTSTCVEVTTNSSVEFGAFIPDDVVEQDVVASEIQPASEGCLPSTALPPSTCTEVTTTVREIKVHRANVRKDMLVIFSDPSILHELILLEVVFINSRGEEEAGRGSGLVRDLFSLFWKDVYQSLMVGEIERVPSIRHDYQKPQWEAVGRILLKGFRSCQYFPLMLSKTFFVSCLFGESEISEEMLIKSFMNFVSESEKNLIERCLNAQVDPSDDELCDLLSTFDCKKVVNASNLKGILTELAHKELIQKPQYVSECWKSVIPWLRDCFPQQSDVDNLYERLHPTVSRVIACFAAEETNEGERDAMKHLKRFVRGLDKAKLGKFLQFVTGSDIMLCDRIAIIFTRLDGIERRPVAHTCTFTLEIPSTYQSFPEFREEFHSILDANSREMDIV